MQLDDAGNLQARGCYDNDAAPTDVVPWVTHCGCYSAPGGREWLTDLGASVLWLLHHYAAVLQGCAVLSSARPRHTH
jgi:hypothetical protein